MTKHYSSKQTGNAYRHLILYAWFIVLGLFVNPVHATSEQPSVLLIADGNQSLMQAFSTQLESDFKQRKITLSSLNLDNGSDITSSDLAAYDLIISLGSSTTDKLLQKNINKPVLSTLIPQQTVQAMREAFPDNNSWSALLIDQPVKRQLLLIKHLFGNHKPIGTILGPYSASMEQELTEQSQALNQSLTIEKIQTSEELAFSLNKLSTSSQVLLAVPDPVAFNRNTIRGILLFTYRHKIPVIGFSQSYVKAGAIASLHTDIAQIAQQAADISRQYFTSGQFSQEYYYPSDFNISFNSMVAGSLQQNLPEPQSIIRLIKQDEAKP